MKDIAELLAVSERSVQAWTKDARKSEREEAQAKAWDMWLDCATQTDIADELGVSQQNVSNWVQNREQSSEICSPPESRQHFDIWQFATADHTRR